MAYLPAGTVTASPMAILPSTFATSSKEPTWMFDPSARTITRSLANMSNLVDASTSSAWAAVSIVPVEAVMSTSAGAPARICSMRSPDALNCVSANVTPVCSV